MNLVCDARIDVKPYHKALYTDLSRTMRVYDDSTIQSGKGFVPNPSIVSLASQQWKQQQLGGEIHTIEGFFKLSSHPFLFIELSYDMTVVAGLMKLFDDRFGAAVIYYGTWTQKIEVE